MHFITQWYTFIHICKILLLGNHQLQIGLLEYPCVNIKCHIKMEAFLECAEESDRNFVLFSHLFPLLGTLYVITEYQIWVHRLKGQHTHDQISMQS